MDINIATRSAASVATSGVSQPVAAPLVSGNGRNRDRLVSRAPGEPEAGSRAGSGDNGELRTKKPGDESSYTAEEQAELQELRARDREVRAHEMAHLAAAGRHSRGGASFTFVTGPDGRRYAVAGEVSIDTSEVAGDPAATLAKAQQVRRAALAPTDPSAQDRQVAARATAMAAKASAELAQERSQAADAAGSPVTGAIEQTYAAPTADDTPVLEVIA